jgi:hypothetical protein
VLRRQIVDNERQRIRRKQILARKKAPRLVTETTYNDVVLIDYTARVTTRPPVCLVGINTAFTRFEDLTYLKSLQSLRTTTQLTHN